MLSIPVSAEEFGLIRLGRKRALVAVFMRPAYWGLGVLWNEDAPTMRLNVEFTRYEVIPVQYLTETDAHAAGFFNLPALMGDLMKQCPRLLEGVAVTLSHFQYQGDTQHEG